jgi:hypothetical protein
MKIIKILVMAGICGALPLSAMATPFLRLVPTPGTTPVHSVSQPDSKQILIFEPLHDTLTPDCILTLTVAGMSFAGIWLCGRKVTVGNK